MDKSDKGIRLHKGYGDRIRFSMRGNTAQLQFRVILDPEDELLVDYPELWQQIWVSTFDNLERGNGHGRILMDELSYMYPESSINLHPAPAKRLREYYKSIGFDWSPNGCYMVRYPFALPRTSTDNLESTAPRTDEFNSLNLDSQFNININHQQD